MKLHYFFILFLVIVPSLCASDRPAADELKTGYQCYCSVKCGPRDVEETDAPFYDEKYGICFCAPRDKVLYEKNQCDKKHNTEFENNYCNIKKQAAE